MSRTETGAPGDLEPQQAVGVEEFENSRRVLGGDYALTTEPSASTFGRYVFTPEGAFARARDGAVTEASEQGTYLIDTKNRLVVYVEERDGNLQTTATLEIFLLEGDGRETLTLVDSSGARSRYARVGEVPPFGSGRPDAE